MEAAQSSGQVSQGKSCKPSLIASSSVCLLLSKTCNPVYTYVFDWLVLMEERRGACWVGEGMEGMERMEGWIEQPKKGIKKKDSRVDA